MSFREETAALAVDLGHLVTSRSSRTLDSDGLAVALLARRDTLTLMRQILLTASGQPRTQAPRDRTGTGALPADVSISYLEDRPVAALLRTLATVPLPTALSDPARTADADGFGSSTGVGSTWAGVRRHAALADHEWAQRAPTPTGDARWSAVADVAAITHAVAVLDHDLLAAARTHPRPDRDVVEALTRSTISGLRVAASEAGAIAAAGPLPDWRVPGPELHATRVLVVRSPGHVLAAQKRLTALISGNDTLGPRAVTHLTDGQARFLTTAAQALAAVDPIRAQQAAALAAALRVSLRSGSYTLATLTPDDPRPLTQTRSLLLSVAVAGSRGWRDPEAQRYLPALAQGIDAARDVVAALAGRARSGLYSGQWLIPTTHQKQPASTSGGAPGPKSGIEASPRPHLDYSSPSMPRPLSPPCYLLRSPFLTSERSKSQHHGKSSPIST